MIEPYFIISNIPHGTVVLVTNNSMDSFLWNFFLVLLIIGGIIIGAMLLNFSKKPDDWEHIPTMDGYYTGGRLNYFANSIKFAPVDYSDYSPLKDHIQMLFFEKVRAIHGISAEELKEIKIKDQNKLRNLIHDKEITDWILNAKKKEEKKGFFGSLKTNKDEKKQKYLTEINTILDKMEAWGE